MSAAVTINNEMRSLLCVGGDLVIIQWPRVKSKAMEIKIKVSPIRLVRAVAIPADRELLFW